MLSIRGAMNCATTNAFFVNVMLSFRNGISSPSGAIGVQSASNPTLLYQINGIHIVFRFHKSIETRHVAAQCPSFLRTIYTA